MGRGHFRLDPGSEELGEGQLLSDLRRDFSREPKYGKHRDTWEEIQTT